MSNLTGSLFESPPLPPSEGTSPPSPEAEQSSSPPSPETEQSSASPPPNNNPTTPQPPPPPDNDDSSPPPQSPPPNSNSNSPPLSPPPQSPPLSPPQSPSSDKNTAPPAFHNPESSPPQSPPPERRQDPSPLAPPTSFSPPQLTISPPPTTVQLTPPSTETPHPYQGFTSPPHSQSPPIQTQDPPIDSPQSPPLQTLSPPTGSPLFDGGAAAVNGTTSTVTTTTLNNGTTSTTTTTSNVTSDDVAVNGGLTKSHIGSIIGGTGVGMLLIVFVVMLFVGRTRKRKMKKKGAKVFDTQYMPQNKSQDMYNIHSSSGPSNAFYTKQPQQYQGTSESNGLGGTKSWFTYEEVMEITTGFSPQNIIGEGGFGCVYKGWLPDGKVVAVKQLKKGSGQGEREFQAEVEIISRVHHRYLVSLVGYCISENQRLLIYEFVPNGTMEHHLHEKGLPVLEWSKRMKIAVGAARGLAYLHEDCHPKIIHRDIKSANILLDDAFEAQVADFGLAKLTDGTNTHVSTRVMGTFGYMAPEYASSGKLTDRSDVFSFGVVLLELITGRKSVDTTQPLGDESLAEWARPHLARALETGDFSEIVDPRLGKQYVESEMFRMVEAAAACVRHSAPKRPRMMQVARSLDCEGETTDLSNGVKYGQSTVYDCGQYNEDMNRFRMMAFGSGHSKEFDMSSRDTTSITRSWKSGDTSIEYPSGESDTQAMNLQRSFK